MDAFSAKPSAVAGAKAPVAEAAAAPLPGFCIQCWKGCPTNEMVPAQLLATDTLVYSTEQETFIQVRRNGLPKKIT